MGWRPAHLSVGWARTRSPSPLTGGVRAVQRVLEVDDGAVAVLQDALLLRVVLHQLRQRRELLPSIQVVEIPRVLDPNVGHLIPHPAGHRAEVRPVDARAEVGTAWGMGGGPGQGAHTGAGWTHTGPGRAGAWATRVRGQVLAPARASGHPPDGEGEVALVLATGPSQEAPVDPSALEQGLGIQATEVSVKPPGRPGGQ